MYMTEAQQNTNTDLQEIIQKSNKYRVKLGLDGGVECHKFLKSSRNLHKKQKKSIINGCDCTRELAIQPQITFYKSLAIIYLQTRFSPHTFLPAIPILLHAILICDLQCSSSSISKLIKPHSNYTYRRQSACQMHVSVAMYKFKDIVLLTALYFLTQCLLRQVGTYVCRSTAHAQFYNQSVVACSLYSSTAVT